MDMDDAMSFTADNSQDSSDGGSFCEEYGNEEDAGALVSGAKGHLKKQEHDVGMFSFLESFSKDMLKVVAGNPDLKKKYQSKLETLLLEATDECTMDSAMVSITAEIEKSPHHCHYKRRHEK